MFVLNSRRDQSAAVGYCPDFPVKENLSAAQNVKPTILLIKNYNEKETQNCQWNEGVIVKVRMQSNKLQDKKKIFSLKKFKRKVTWGSRFTFTYLILHFSPQSLPLVHPCNNPAWECHRLPRLPDCEGGLCYLSDGDKERTHRHRACFLHILTR